MQAKTNQRKYLTGKTHNNHARWLFTTNCSDEIIIQYDVVICKQLYVHSDYCTIKYCTFPGCEVSHVNKAGVPYLGPRRTRRSMCANKARAPVPPIERCLGLCWTSKVWGVDTVVALVRAYGCIRLSDEVGARVQTSSNTSLSVSAPVHIWFTIHDLSFESFGISTHIYKVWLLIMCSVAAIYMQHGRAWKLYLHYKYRDPRVGSVGQHGNVTDDGGWVRFYARGTWGCLFLREQQGQKRELAKTDNIAELWRLWLS